jgi:hypothetical protein
VQKWQNCFPQRRKGHQENLVAIDFVLNQKDFD